MTINLMGNAPDATASLRSIVPFSSMPASPASSAAANDPCKLVQSPLLSRLCGTPTNARRLLLFLSVIGVWFCATLILSNNEPLKEHRSALHTSRELTVVINTFKRPPQIVKDAVEFYAQCEVVKHVFVIWSEQAAPPPKLLANFATWKTPTVTFQRMPTASLNNRFKPLEGPHTPAIFAVDDDMRVPCEDIALAFEVWQGSSKSLVGFMPRIHIRSKTGLVYRCWWRVWWHGVYSIILTKAALLHHDFFVMYTNAMPQSVRDLVDRVRNCEDLAMQFLMANATGLPPIYVKGHVQDLGVFNGISTSKNVASAHHMDGRSKCLNALTEIYGGRVPLVISHVVVDSAANSWTNRPSSWWEYISSDVWAGLL